MKWRGSLCAMLCLAMCLAAVSQADETLVRFDIPAAEARTGLAQFARQSGTPVLYMNEVLGPRRTNAVNGDLTVRHALEILLRNTGITGVINKAGVLTISVAGAENNAATGGTRMQEHDNQTKRGATLLAAVAAFFAAGFTAHADENSTQPQATSGLEEIVVTARRREENLQTVPIAITAISEQKLEDNNVHTLADLQYLAPTLSAAANNYNRDTVGFSIRGQGVNTLSSTPGVVTYLNEVPVPTILNGFIGGGPGLLFDMENVQILEGPQGTLFGQNAVGGAVLLQTARPTNELGGHLQLTYGNYNDREVDAALNIPIIDEKLLVRVAINGQLRDGYTFVQSEPGHPNGIDDDNRDYGSVRGTVIFHPIDAFENDTVLTSQSYSTNGSGYVLTNVFPGNIPALFPNIGTFLAQQQAVGDRTAIPRSVSDAGGGSLLLINNISRITFSDNLTFRNIFGYVHEKEVFSLDGDSTTLPADDYPAIPSRGDSKQYSDEAQLQGHSLGGRLDWITGLFYSREIYGWPEYPAGGDFAITQGVFYGIFPVSLGLKTGATSAAGYGQGTYDLSDLISGLKLTGGVRYTDDRYSQDNIGGVFDTCIPEPGLPVMGCNTVQSQHTTGHAITWTVGLDYQVAQDTLVYVTSRRGYGRGGFNSFDQPSFGPQYVTDAEVGIKADWHLGPVGLRTNANAFYQDFTNIQVTEQVQLPGLPANSPASITGNAAAARITGAELQAEAVLTKDFRVGADFAYLNYAYTDFGSDVNAANIQELLDSRTQNRPRIKYGVNAVYKLPLSETVGEISGRANWTWQSSSGTTQYPGGIIDSYGVLNMSLDWNGIYRSPIDASLFVTNLTDKVYASGLLTSNLGLTNTLFGEPRMYGIRVKYRFGAESR